MNPRADGELPHVSSLALHHAPFLTTMLGFVEGGGRYSKPWCHLSRYCLVFLPLLSRMAACQDITVMIISMNRNIHLLDFLREINLCIAIEVFSQIPVRSKYFCSTILECHTRQIIHHCSRLNQLSPPITTLEMKANWLSK